MGKLIPPLHETNVQEAEHIVAGEDRAGLLQTRSKELANSLRRAEEEFDLDELDRLARRHARTPASGSAEALEALSVVVRCAPELFSRAEVNLQPSRLEGLADRERALSVLCPVIIRLSDLVQDSQLEQGDEIVELLTVGCRQAEGLDSARLYSNDRLAQAMHTLTVYQRRVGEEGAHLSAETRDRSQPKKKKH